MLKGHILIAWSNYYTDLSEKPLLQCIDLLKKLSYEYTVETIHAGSYEIPAVIQSYDQYHPFDGYIPLALLVKGQTDHYEFIWSHLQHCFTEFALKGLCIGNAVITAPSLHILTERIVQGERIQEAVQAVDYLIQLKNKIIRST
jgi:6,7-dimethyl-8-ribityllumazine synthase